MDDTPIKDAHLVGKYSKCTSYDDVLAVDTEILQSLGADGSAQDILELHCEYPRQEIPGWGEATQAFSALGTPNKE